MIKQSLVTKFTCIALGLAAAGTTSAAIVNFRNVAEGIVFQGGAAVGTIRAEFNYNLRDTGINALGSNDTTRPDRFPDKMRVTCESGLQNNGVLCDPISSGGNGNVNAFQSWGFDAVAHTAANPSGAFGIATYSPFSAFQDEYSVKVILNLTSGANVGTFSADSDISKITIVNNIERNFSVFHDTVRFDTGIGSFTFDNLGFPLSVPPIPQVAPLTNIYLEDALLALNQFPTSESSFQIGLLNSGYFGRMNSISELQAVPEPGNWPLFALGLTGLVYSLRNRQS